MKQEEVIYIEGVNKREIKSIVKRFCSEESGKGVRFTVYLHRLEGKAYALNFPQAIPFDLFCELLFKLDTLPNDKRKVRAYCKRKQKGSGLPAESMIYVNDSSKSDFAAVDTKGNVYEDDINTEPYSFKSTGEQAIYIPFMDTKFPSASNIHAFRATEEKFSLWQRICNKVQGFMEDWRSCTSGCLPIIIVLGLFCYSASLNLRTADGNLSWYLLLIGVLVGLLTSFTKHRYSINVVIVWFAIPVLIYIPNYYFSGPLEKRKAVIEKIYKGGRHKRTTFARLRFGNDDTFTIGYKVNENLMHVGDTCILNIGKGLWGMDVCRGVMCNGKQIYKH